ncbi:DUF6968 family protein [Umezawaea beigongshangensis]|uniref:DUF6968 family protein n=1 Tax=Umezawaea beigongshangensis TaxID=2780383 RepID=UPI0018F1CEFF|nr:hypothetical protein [Umezawaea beigongshangensis]
MTTYELGEVVAERQLASVTVDGAQTPVVIRVGTPRPDPRSTSGAWCCPHQITGLGDEAVRACYGVDSVQALLLSAYGLRMELSARAAEAGTLLNWLGMSDLGLKVDPGLEWLLEATDPERGGAES